MAKKVKTRRKLVLLFSAIIGLIAVILAIVGIVTRNWISVQGNTNELQNNFGQLLDANGTFVVTAAAVLTTLGIPEPLTKLIVIGLANATLTQVEGQLSNNLQSTTYSLFDKKVSVARTEVPELKLSQGLVIAGLVCLFSGTLLATLILCIPVNLRYIGLIAIVSLFFLALGSILILLGYLLFTRAITEDFGHELGIKVTLGNQARKYRSCEEYQRSLQLYLHAYHLGIKTQIDLPECISDLEEYAITMGDMIHHNRAKKIQFDLFLKVLQATENECIRNRNLTSALDVKQKNQKFLWSSNQVDDIEILEFV
ncbi:unnamed protein product [Rotaria sordida]|uniref:Uncharacterized protein n=1 Tax=Rotaria sordida TaxID=392033 RepID=A0A819G3M8_9BILA|nr:unnamed protein product [Rotaria sordida]